MADDDTAPARHHGHRHHQRQRRRALQVGAGGVDIEGQYGTLRINQDGGLRLRH